MKLQGRITLLIDSDETRIEIEDDNANTRFCKIILDPTQTIKLLSRQASVKCELEVKGIDRIGKTHENKDFEFPVITDTSQGGLMHDCNIALFNDGMNEWVSDHYYNSQNTLFKKDEKQWARTTIRRWV